MLIINLTEDQQARLAGAYEQIGEMAAAGKPGTLCAQIYKDHMRVGIMSNESMTKLYEAMGTPKERQTAHRSAFHLQEQRRGFDTLPDDYETGDY